ncbi:MAG TPA: 30S ribosomal protein S9 [Candidatus Sumerlaeota bacterium]|nr:30S ribosomal protein S9 [Candidatus Sumerlaeota bacterium]
MSDRLEQYTAVGRRKTSVARIYLRPGKGKLVVNEQPWNKYFGERPLFEAVMREPQKETHTLTKYDVVVTVRGGGHVGQIGAIRHGISRALALANPALRGTLKKAGFLTRDARMKERKKYGLAGARKRYQFSKR